MWNRLPTPTRQAWFTYEIDLESSVIRITSEAQNTHEYHLDALRDLYDWLKAQPEQWVFLGSRGEEETPNEGTVEAWARSENNPRGGFYGLTRGRRGRFASYIPSILEHMGFVEVEHAHANNRMRARV